MTVYHPGPRGHLLLVEDDPEIAQMLVGVLTANGFTVSAVGTAVDMDAVLRQQTVDLVVLDILLPGEDGLSICRRLRAASAIPIIMVTALGQDIDRIVGLEIGADDYLCKPFNPRELVARIRSLLRRAEGGRVTASNRVRELEFSGWRINLATRQLHDPENLRVAITSVEFDLLATFCRNPGQILTRDQLVELTNYRHAVSSERIIDVHVSRIRQKIEADPRNPCLIKTVRFAGYLFTPTVEEV